MKSLYKERVEGGRGENSFVPWQEMEGSFLLPTCTDCEVWVEGGKGLSLNLNLYSICWPSIDSWYSHCHRHLCCTGLWGELSLVSGTACTKTKKEKAHALVAIWGEKKEKRKRLNSSVCSAKMPAH